LAFALQLLTAELERRRKCRSIGLVGDDLFLEHRFFWSVVCVR